MLVGPEDYERRVFATEESRIRRAVYAFSCELVKLGCDPEFWDREDERRRELAMAKAIQEYRRVSYDDPPSFTEASA
jgi:hypothetical protein